MLREKWIIPSIALLVFGLAGCSGNKSGANEQYRNNARPIGYYSNENHPNQTSTLLNDNDGPITEFLDHGLGSEGKMIRDPKNRIIQTRDENGNPPNPTVPLVNQDQNFYRHDNRFSTSDANYSGYLHEKSGVFSQDPATLGKLSDQIRRKVEQVKNVRDVRSIVYGSSILISVHLNDKSQVDNTKKEIKNAVKPYTNGRAVTIITDEGTISRNRTIKDDLREGGAR